MQDEKYIEHEVQLRLQDEKFVLMNNRTDDRFTLMNNRIDERFEEVDRKFEKIDQRFEKLESKMDSQFQWTIGIMITMFGGLIITKLI